MVLTYHEIVLERSSYRYSVTAAQFEEHLRAVAPVSARSQYPLLTFDDGHASHYRYAAPALQRAGLKGIFFVTAGWTDRKAGYMGVAQLRDLLAAGHEVQSHGWSHTLLTACSREALSMELRHSREFLEHQLGVRVDAISMPGGRWNDRILEACAEEGYARVFTSDPEFPSRQQFPGVNVFGRVMVQNRHGVSDVEAFLDGRVCESLRDQLLSAFKHTARQVIGDTAYHRVWHFLARASQKDAINARYGE